MPRAASAVAAACGGPLPAAAKPPAGEQDGATQEAGCPGGDRAQGDWDDHDIPAAVAAGIGVVGGREVELGAPVRVASGALRPDVVVRGVRGTDLAPVLEQPQAGAARAGLPIARPEAEKASGRGDIDGVCGSL